MKKLLTGLLLGLLLLTGCNNEPKYRFKIIDSLDFVTSNHKNHYREGEQIRIETGILYDAYASMYVNDEFYKNSTSEKNSLGKYINVYDFVMPAYDVTITFVVKDGMLVYEPEIIEITFIQLNFVNWQNYEDYYIPIFGDEELTTTVLPFEEGRKLTNDDIQALKTKEVLDYKVPPTMYGYYTFEGFYFDKVNTQPINTLTPEITVTDHLVYYYGLTG